MIFKPCILRGRGGEMNRVIRWSALVALLVAFGLIAASCGDDDDSESSSQPAPQETEDSSGDGDGEPAADDASEPEPEPEDESEEPGPDAARSAADLRVAMVSDGEPNLGGWYGAMELGRIYLEDAFDGLVVETFNNVAPGQVAQQTFEDLAADGYDVIISVATFDADIATIAPDYPDTVFFQSCDATVLENMAQYCPATEQARYVDGVLAASLSTKGKIGYVVGFGIPHVIKPLNAFTLGAQSVNPDIEVEVVATSSWFDPTLERQAAEALVNNGADVLTYDLSSSAIPEVASENGIPFVGFGYADAATQAPEIWAGGSLYQWGPMWVEQFTAILDGTWATTYAYGGYESGYLSYTDLGASVPADVATAVEDALAGLESGAIQPLLGPLADREGNEVVAEGEFADGGACCEWILAGIVGDVG